MGCQGCHLVPGQVPLNAMGVPDTQPGRSGNRDKWCQVGTSVPVAADKTMGFQQGCRRCGHGSREATRNKAANELVAWRVYELFSTIIKLINFTVVMDFSTAVTPESFFLTLGGGLILFLSEDMLQL